MSVTQVFPSAISVHDEGENIAMPRGKSSLAPSGNFNVSAIKQRAVLGDICSNRSALTNVVSEVDFKKPQHVPSKSVAKKQIQEIENLPLPSEKEVVKPAVEAQRRSSFSSQNLEFDDIDTETNPQLVAVYVKDIYKYLNELEEKTVIKSNYMEIGYKIKPHMRTILIDWLVEVHIRFKLLQETLYLTVATMDRFLQVEPSVVRHDLQLVGLTSMFIASKFEEMYTPEIDDFVFMSDKAYTKKEVLRMELRILKALDFNLGRPLPLHFLRRYTKAATHVYDWVDVLHHTLSKYLMELSLPEYEFCHVMPSQLAAASLCLSLKILDEHENPIDVLWNDTLIYYSGYTYEALEPIVEKFCSLIIKSETSKHQAIRRKYRVSKFYQISALPHLRSPATHAFLAKMALKNSNI
ncbi:G2/mitotic-specific cyclin-B-like [Daphnia pulex]|uniref:G2/mitotic-specific cyclin-B-like n=1 Tax=Daphnia pulex TaxID=6669 RepID=UPI001EE11593|nr:G2/mitotic-specific cyclin-B-like [Daphnia pulex]